MRIYTTFDSANEALAEFGGWIVQTAESEYWHCQYSEECIDLLTRTGASRSLARRYVRDSDDEGKYTIDAREFVADYAEPLRGLCPVGPSADWIDEAYPLGGDSDALSVVIRDDYNEWRIFTRYVNQIDDYTGQAPDIDRFNRGFSTPREAIEAFRAL